MYSTVAAMVCAKEKDNSGKKRNKSKTCNDITNPVQEYSKNVTQEKIKGLVSEFKCFHI
jgi:hypothetical protein